MTESYYWLAGVDVLARAGAGTLVTFGDSITDGDQSTPDTSRMWPAVLATRLQASAATRNIGVVNAGISGNRVLGDNNSGVVTFPSARVECAGRQVDHRHGGDQRHLRGDPRESSGGRRGRGASRGGIRRGGLIRSYRQMIEQAHLRGVKVIGCTLTPFGGSSTFTERGEAIRTAVNNWIRTSGAFDAVVDFDAATRDAADPTRFRSEADSPDLLHPGDGGYRLMAEAVNLGVFKTGVTKAGISTAR